MYSTLPSIVLGFHGCDKKVGESILSGKDSLKLSTNDYDWLGNGIYFWENSPERAMEYANSIKKHPHKCKEKIDNPFVIGAIIDLGHCLNLLDFKFLKMVKDTYDVYSELCKVTKQPLPENKSIKDEDDVLIRKLDCAVIQTLHKIRKLSKNPEIYNFDSVRGMFTEGKPLYENSGFNIKNHIQICVRNPNCIKGYFNVLEHHKGFHIP